MSMTIWCGTVTLKSHEVPPMMLSHKFRDCFVLVLYALDGRSGNRCDIGDTEQESFGCPCPDMLPKLGFFCSFWNSARRPPAGDQEDQESAGGLLDQQRASSIGRCDRWDPFAAEMP